MEGMTMRKHAWLLLVLTALIFSQIDVASGAETLTLGHLNALSGGVALYGKDSKNAITMGVEEINSKGGITVAGKNYKIEVIHYDTKFKPSTALSAYRRLVDLHNVKFIHNMGTQTGRAIVPHNENDKVLLDDISSTETFCHHGNKLLLVQVVRPNGYNTPVARAAVRVGLKRMCILADDSLFGRESGGLVKKEFERLGGTVIASEFVDTTLCPY
jgi:branched-chain amino acid transport system substrate-binding protein